MKKVAFDQLRFLSVLVFGIMLLISVACEHDNEKQCADAETGILKNLTGLDGCGWIIQLADSTRLEPINLNEFDIELKEDKVVCFRYHERPDMGSYCMVGPVVEIDFIE